MYLLLMLEKNEIESTPTNDVLHMFLLYLTKLIFSKMAAGHHLVKLSQIPLETLLIWTQYICSHISRKSTF